MVTRSQIITSHLQGAVRVWKSQSRHISTSLRHALISFLSSPRPHFLYRTSGPPEPPSSVGTFPPPDHRVIYTSSVRFGILRSLINDLLHSLLIRVERERKGIWYFIRIPISCCESHKLLFLGSTQNMKHDIIQNINTQEQLKDRNTYI